jgi:hypothetical protein
MLLKLVWKARSGIPGDLVQHETLQTFQADLQFIIDATVDGNGTIYDGSEHEQNDHEDGAVPQSQSGPERH